MQQVEKENTARGWARAAVTPEERSPPARPAPAAGETGLAGFRPEGAERLGRTGEGEAWGPLETRTVRGRAGLQKVWPRGPHSWRLARSPSPSPRDREEAHSNTSGPRPVAAPRPLTPGPARAGGRGRRSEQVRHFAARIRGAAPGGAEPGDRPQRPPPRLAWPGGSLPGGLSRAAESNRRAISTAHLLRIRGLPFAPSNTSAPARRIPGVCPTGSMSPSPSGTWAQTRA